jgi:hypothetical protein
LKEHFASNPPTSLMLTVLSRPQSCDSYPVAVRTKELMEAQSG